MPEPDPPGGMGGMVGGRGGMVPGIPDPEPGIMVEPGNGGNGQAEAEGQVFRDVED